MIPKTFFNKMAKDLGYTERPYVRIEELIDRVNWLLEPNIEWTRVALNFDNFQGACGTTTMDGYTVTQATTGAVSIVNGVLLIDSAGGGEGQGLNVQKTTGPYFVPAANRTIWFKCRFKVVDNANDVQLFIGLAEADTTLITSSEMDETNSDFVGFSIEKDAAGAMKCHACNTTDGDEDTAATLVNDTWTEVAFRINGVTSIDFWIDGTKATLSNITADNIPTSNLIPSFVCQADDGGTDPILHVKYYEVMAN